MGILEGILYMMWRGIAIGIIISAPMGPVGILCVQRTLDKGRWTGLYTGIGAALSDLIYCLLTGFGLSLIEEFLERNQNIIQLIGSLVLVVFGIYLFKSNPSRQLKKPADNKVSVKRNILSGFLFTFSNPLIIFLIIGLFARFNFMLPEIKFYHYIIGFISIFVGAIFWWYLVTLFVDKVRAHFNLRSMWLVNKIIGSIVMIFAVVGIITACTGIASAANRQAIYLNSRRGFGVLSDSVPLLLDNKNATPLFRQIEILPSSSVTLKARVTNHNNLPGTSYSHRGSSSQEKKLRHPRWGIAYGTAEKADTIIFQTVDNPRDETYTVPSLTIRHNTSATSQEPVSLTSGAAIHNGENSVRLIFENGHASLHVGDREYQPVGEWRHDYNEIDHIAFIAFPSARIEIDNISLEYEPTENLSDISYNGNPDVLETRLARSTDLLEGIWAEFDRTLEESLLRMGGDYRFAILKDNAEEYRLIYLSGAVKNSKAWKPGMTKARLINTPFDNIYDVLWTTAGGETLPGTVKAQYDGNSSISFQFPDHQSTLRLKRIPRGRFRQESALQ